MIDYYKRQQTMGWGQRMRPAAAAEHSTEE